MPRPGLRERKQQRARDEIVKAAYELFAERGYTDVTVTDIVERAEIGRTTFFRYYGDKQEVVFADEQSWMDNVGQRYREVPVDRPPSLPEALAALREIVAAISAAATRNPDRYVQRERLIADNPELSDRAARKQRRFAEMISNILGEQGASAETAALAPQLAVACYNAGHQLAAGIPAKLGPSVDAAFAQLTVTSSTPRPS